MSETDGAFGPQDLSGWDPAEELGAPGEYPYTRGPYPSMYTGRLWTMRQYAGFGTAAATNERFRQLLDAGQTGLSVAFDLPTQMGLDSDDPLAAGEVGKVGVAIDTVDDLRVLFSEIPLAKVSTSMTINATAAVLLLMYQIVAEEQGASPDEIKGTIQNDILKEYIARGTYIFPAGPSMRIITDIFSYCAAELPNWNTISISGYHIREAGSTASQEVAFTIANGLAYVQAALAAGLAIDSFAPRLSFFWNAHNNLFEEAAKYRAARRLWARLMRDRVGATEPASWRMRFHTQTAGSTLTAQQPLNNVVRTSYQALAAVLGGTQSLHTNSYDEALGLPTEDAVTIALRTQQILGYESGVADAVDPLAGSYYIESMTDRIESEAMDLILAIDDKGGAVAAIESGFQQRHIEDAAYAHATSVDSGDATVVGVNRFTTENDSDPEVMSIDPAVEREQVDLLASRRRNRDNDEIDRLLAEITAAAEGDTNLLYPMKSALAAGASVGDITGALLPVFGRYRPAF
ncbi:MAG: acyl-CoA mutase large subunit family protein [Acidimicrobiia bacterium]